ncbi:glutamate racemase [Dolichospermum circinale CS-1225]|uniref:Glutamate racemase n=1 Tax=Dolichospermum circinale CS-537/01 TaxID=3021739 RepID=A0ABT5A0K6_9CYAN|nr:glutamate racemase [Dolichospermum circinale]MDB9457934.1 glutamate racemase [Dolichospermum circinale CS-545/17]MDB9466334.1 glutamate racemase [Dolichospermum circinale CS-539/09]MDB9470455.1 glutamate racemase [Dolichospermum circinale CS-539]MDB9485452.1 glutamate racemase [Dolichospermum circinale CS-537/01]MDB9520369.1 glutamate racemase [Dolichospermum circinale CS-1225]
MCSFSIFDRRFHGFYSQLPQRAPIGVFDSGVGGLTVLRQLYQQLPNESIIYVGDTARLPYGIRSQGEILQFVREILCWMRLQGVKMAIMACNTSSALALDIVRQEFDFPILGVILPGAMAAVEQGQRIGVIATPATAQSNAYRQAILEIKSHVQVWQVSCPEFVPLIEQNRIHDPYTAQIAKTYLEPLLRQEIDTLVYGCTHYPHLSPVLRSLLPTQVKLIDPAVHVVVACSQELDILGIKNTYPPMPTRFAVSGCPQQFTQSGLQWLGYTPMVEQVCFADAVVS